MNTDEHGLETQNHQVIVFYLCLSCVDLRPYSARLRTARSHPSALLKLINLRRPVLRGNLQARAQAAAVQRLPAHHAHDLRIIVLLAQSAEHQVRGRGVQVVFQEVPTCSGSKGAERGSSPAVSRSTGTARLSTCRYRGGLEQQQVGAPEWT